MAIPGSSNTAGGYLGALCLLCLVVSTACGTTATTGAGAVRSPEGYPIRVNNLSLDVVEIRIRTGSHQTARLGRAMPGRTRLFLPRAAMGAADISFLVCAGSCTGPTARVMTDRLPMDRSFATPVVYPFSRPERFLAQVF